MFVEFGWRPWSSRGAYSSVVCSLGGVRAGSCSRSSGGSPRALGSSRPRYELLFVTVGRWYNLLVFPFLLLEPETKGDSSECAAHAQERENKQVQIIITLSAWMGIYSVSIWSSALDVVQRLVTDLKDLVIQKDDGWTNKGWTPWGE